jgi:hypothetical protein
MRPFATIAALAALSCGPFLTPLALAQPAKSPTTSPATARARYVFPIPQGFEKVTVANHTAVCLPEDLAWVKQAMEKVKPATKPATMPSDLLKRLADHRSALIKQMVSDLALPDDKHVSDFVDNKLADSLKKLDGLRPPIYFFVVTREKLRDLVKTGWGEPRFRYNRAADAASYDDNVMVSIDRPMDDSPLPVFYEAKDKVEERVDGFAKMLGDFDARLATLISRDSQTGVFNLFAQYLGDKHFEPLNLRRDQQWLSLGIVTYLSSKYSALLTAIPRDQWLRGLMFENPQTMLSSAPIDLTSPVAEASMKPAMVPHYNQAMRRKATAAVMKLVETGGESAIPKALIGVVKNKPADGKETVKVVQQATGVDLTAALAPQ